MGEEVAVAAAVLVVAIEKKEKKKKQKEVMDSASLLSYKKNFKASPVLERFYTGGALVVAGDGTFVACACVDDVKIVDLATGLTTKTLKGDSEIVTAIALSSSDGKSLFVASRSLQIKHWDLASESCLRTWKVKKSYATTLLLSARAINV
jgi:U3 small nucleolar RNA-associated protein 13